MNERAAASAYANRLERGTWLAQSGEEPAHAPVVEEYLNDARTVPPPELKTEIWLPLA